MHKMSFEMHSNARPSQKSGPLLTPWSLAGVTLLVLWMMFLIQY